MKSLLIILLVSPLVAVGMGKTAPGFSARTLKGKQVRLSSLRGRVVLLDFWASWCSSCEESLGFYEKMRRRYKGKLAVLAISVDREKKNVRRFLKKVRVHFPVVHDPSGRIIEKFALRDLPSTVVIDRRGRVRHIARGFSTNQKKALSQAVTAIIRRSK